MLIIHEKLEIARNSTVFRSSVIYITRKINPLNLPPCNFVKKETLALTFSCEFCEIFKSTFFIKHIRTTAPGYHFKQNWNLYVPNFKTESGTSISSKNNCASKHQRTFYYNKTNAWILLFFRIALLSRVYPHFILNILKIWKTTLNFIWKTKTVPFKNSDKISAAFREVSICVKVLEWHFLDSLLVFRTLSNMFVLRRYLRAFNC